MNYSWVESMWNTRSYRKDTQGNMAIATAITGALLLGAGGVAIDYSNMSHAKNEVQNAIDAGVLAAAVLKTDSEQKRQDEGKRITQQNAILQGLDDLEVTIEVDENGGVHGTARLKYSPIFLKARGGEAAYVSAEAFAASDMSQPEAEIVLVLDYSSSMGDHYEEMRDAAIQLVNDLSIGDGDAVQFGLVPFAEEVYLQVDGRYIDGGTAGSPWQGCTMSRRWPFVISDRTPNGSWRSRWGRDGDDCDEYSSRQLVAQPLTADRNAVINQLRAMQPHEGTNTSLGMEIGYQMVSPNLPFKASNYLDGKAKFIVVLSDGELTRGSYGPGDRFDETQATDNLAAVCSAAASNAVTVITVLYETTDPAARAAMTNCASSPDLFMEATSGNIADRFDTITQLIQSGVRLTG